MRKLNVPRQFIRRSSKMFFMFVISALVLTAHIVQAGKPEGNDSQKALTSGNSNNDIQSNTSGSIKLETNTNDISYREEFYPLDLMDYLGLGMLALMLIIATLGGVGGNVVILPIWLVFFRFSPHAAIAHTTLFACAGSVSRVVIEISKGTNGYEQKMINYDVVLIVSGPTILGSFLGVTFNKMSPDLWILVCATILLLYLLVYSFKQFIEQQKKEKQAYLDSLKKKQEKIRRNSLDLSNVSSSVNETFHSIADDSSDNIQINLNKSEDVGFSNKSEDVGFSNESEDWLDRNKYKKVIPYSDYDEEKNKNRRLSFYFDVEETVSQDRKEEFSLKNEVSTDLSTPLVCNEDGTKYESKKKIPNKYQYIAKKSDIAIIFLLLWLNPAISVLRGSHTMKSVIGNEQWSPEDFILLILYSTILVSICLYNRHLVIERNKFSAPVGKIMNLDKKSWNKIMILILGATFLGGFLSAGSSTLITVWLIVVGINPFIASPTALLIVFVFTSSTALVYFINGFIYVSSAIIGSLVVLASTVITRMTIYQYFLTKNKSSVVMLFICLMSVISVPTNIWVITPKIIEDYNNGANIFGIKTFW